MRGNATAPPVATSSAFPPAPWRKAILAEVLAALDHGPIFQGAARRAQQAWHAQHPGRQAELAGVRATLAERRAATDRYLRAFQARRLPASACADRLAELDQQAQGLLARAAVLEAECDTAQLRQLLDAVVDRIAVESRACVQPFLVAPAVRTRAAPRRRTTKHPNTGAPGPALWVSARDWGRA